MYLKPGTNLQGLTTPMLLGLFIADGVYREFANHEITLTSGDDGKHGLTSLHNSGNAYDLRTNDLPEVVSRKELAGEIKERVGEDFDVIFEHDPEDPDNEHIHIEYQPRRRR